MLPDPAVVEFSRALCDAGGKVMLKVYEGAGHSGPMNTGPPDFTRCVAARFAGEPAGDTCATDGSSAGGSARGVGQVRSKRRI
jgi:hypothetical protein